MESKRKSNGGVAAGQDLDDRAAKRRKLPSDNIDTSIEETPETTTVHGLKLVETIKKTEDKSGRVISTSFLTLPKPHEAPDYYKLIKMPIAIDTIQKKLVRREFKNLSDLESYFKRMISNAKEYNQKGSEVYDDAERLRKALSNFMTKTNPAYKLIEGYAAAPTPIPVDPVEALDVDADGELDSEAEAAVTKKSRGRPPKTNKSSSTRKSITPAVSDGRHSSTGFAKLTFQQAQEKILQDLVQAKEHPDDDFANFEPFIVLPDAREVKDYYQVIQHPVSLQSVQNRVKGSSEFKTWAVFETEMKYIWSNAWLYNEDGSDISLLAKELQMYFNKLFREAKKTVQEPAAPKIKLRMPEPAPKITLKMSARGSPVDPPALQINGSNGTPANGPRRNPFGSTATPIPVINQLDRARSASGPAPSPTPTPSIAPVVKSEDVARNSPAIQAVGYNNYRGPSQAVSTPGLTGSVMAPPSTPGFPNQNLYSAGGYAQSFPHQPQFQTQNAAFDTKWRQPGKGISDAMITNLSLVTHPGLNISRHFRMDMPASPTMAQQSITINLPHTHYYLQIKPTINSFVLSRHYKLFTTAGTQRLSALPPIPGGPMDQGHPLFETRLLPGVNRIEIELIAALPKTAGKPAIGPEVELEKFTVYANLLKDPQQR